MPGHVARRTRDPPFGVPVAIGCPAEEGAPGWSFCAPPDSGTWFEAASFKFWETYLTAWLGDPMPPSPVAL